MSILGGAKIFEGIYNLLADGASIAESSGNADPLLGRNPFQIWKSVGSDDMTTETLTITLPSAIEFDRILVIDHNWKQFQVQYGSGPSDFSNVIGVNGEVIGSALSDTDNARSSNYFEFDAVTDDTIIFTIDTTQTVDAEKRAGQIIITKEFHTLAGWPGIQPQPSRNKVSNRSLSGRNAVNFGIDLMGYRVNVRGYPTKSEYQTDIQKILQLYYRDTPFLFYPCGGRAGTDYFRHTIPGFRLRDCPLVQIENEIDPRYEVEIYVNGVSFAMNLEEVPG